MIKMKAGVFGLTVNGITKPMDKNSGPFRANAEQEARLVALGMAEYVPDPEALMEQDTSKDNDDTNTGDIDPVGFDETPPEDDGEPELPEDVIPIPEYSAENTAAELREIGKLCGLTFKSGMTKAEMVAALDAHIEANMVDGVEITDDDAEDDGEPAPTFDASEAVL